ncbi:MAG: gamma carbonic anhydrase family protein [Rhodomicrobium sp.]
MVAAPANAPLLLPFDGVEPRFGEGARFLGPGASVLGKVETGANAAIAGGAAIRGDGHFVRIGDEFFIGEMGTVHIAQDLYPTIIGNRVTVGRNAVVHACTVGEDCVIEDNAAVLDGSVLENGALIEADSIVFPKSKLAGGLIYAGIPAKPVRAVTPEEREARAQRLRQAPASVFLARKAANVIAPETAFIAKTARLSGLIELQDRASVFFGCDFDAAGFRIVIGERTNIQDNTSICCEAAETVIGRDTTLGHNVRLASCRIGERALIGIGAVLAAGTIVEDGTMLAAGATTLPGQRLESGWLWGGRPARPLSRLDDAKRGMMQTIAGHYCAYAAAYARAQEQLGRL